MKRIDSRALAISAALLAASCSYSYKNPAEALHAGEVQGRVVAQRPGEVNAFDPLSGVSVGLRNSGLAATSRPNGFFTYLDLPPGRHMLLFRQGLDRAAAREVEVELGSDGQPQGTLMGDVALAYMVNVGGSVVTENVDINGYDECVVVDAVTGLRTFCDQGYNRYEFPALPIGDHELRFAATWSIWSGESQQYFTLVGGPVSFTLTDADQRTHKTLAPVMLHLAVPTEKGELVFRLRMVGATGVKPGDLQITVTDLSLGTPVEPPPVPDSAGLVDMTPVSEGWYQVSVSAPADAAGGLIMPPPLNAIVLAGETTDLGDVYVVAQGTADRSQLECRSDADCLAPGTCVAGLCSVKPPADVSPLLDLCPITSPCDEAGMCSPTTNYECARATDLPYGFCIPCEASYSCIAPCSEASCSGGFEVIHGSGCGPVAFIP